MALPYHIFLSLLLLLLLPSPSQSKLNLDYYTKTCPNLHQIITQVVTEKQISAPTTAAAALRLFFHDCMVGGCDASVLVTSNSFTGKSERDAEINLSLPGDGLDVVTRAKTAVELQCPGIVSCADILAIAARDLVTMVGGPYYKVRLGRKDGFTSKAFEVIFGLCKLCWNILVRGFSTVLYRKNYEEIFFTKVFINKKKSGARFRVFKCI